MTLINIYHKYKINFNIINIKQYYSLKNSQKPKCKINATKSIVYTVMIRLYTCKSVLL